MARIDNHWFSFRDIASHGMGVKLRTLPEFKAFERKGAAVDVAGRNGSLWLDDGDTFNAFDLRLELLIGPEAQIDRLYGWLNGSGNLVFGFRDAYALRARVTKPLEQRFVITERGWRTLAVTFTCQPFWYEREPQRWTIESSDGATRHFPGCGDAPARPIIQITTVIGEPNASFRINGATVIIDGIEKRSNWPHYVLELDCETMMVSGGTCSALTLVPDDEDGDEWPVLYPGENYVELISGVETLEILPNWRYF